mmetsp:Transcript_70177/g.221635  ORF Transcript_70177/g.221635 Transcript_70177/m.221635 type:complete len:202 (+) Transcript_70177:166-771(+)
MRGGGMGHCLVHSLGHHCVWEDGEVPRVPPKWRVVIAGPTRGPAGRAVGMGTCRAAVPCRPAALGAAVPRVGGRPRPHWNPPRLVTAWQSDERRERLILRFVFAFALALIVMLARLIQPLFKVLPVDLLVPCLRVPCGKLLQLLLNCPDALVQSQAHLGHVAKHSVQHLARHAAREVKYQLLRLRLLQDLQDEVTRHLRLR